MTSPETISDTATQQAFYGMTYEGLIDALRHAGLNTDAASRVFSAIYKHDQPVPWDTIAKQTRAWMEASLHFDLPEPAHIHEASDRTVKFLFRMSDGHTVESVLIPFQGKYTLCLSSQVGCAMKCSFCHTGTQGLSRHLTADEIIGQFVGARKWLLAHRPDEAKILNVVFMGQGEPLHNFDEVKTACEILLARNGICMADHKITVSTSGYMPGLQRWNDEMPSVNIALSLHATDEAKRNELIPINVKWPLPEIMAYLDTIPMGRKRFITFEYLLLKGFNDSEADAQSLGELLKDRPTLLNIIPFNPYPGSQYERPSDDDVQQFAAQLDPFGFPVMVRTTKGDDILAACGQLKTEEADRTRKAKNLSKIAN